MTDLDVLADRLHQLGQCAPVPVADPLMDIRRGRTALRRRHARGAAGFATALVAVGAVAANAGSLSWPGGSTETVLEPAGSASGGGSTPTAATTPAAGTEDCTITVDPSATAVTEGRVGASTSRLVHDRLTRTPEVTAALTAYRQAAAAILDPTGEHLDAADDQRSDSVQGGYSCDPKTGMHLTELGTKIGWTSGGALGVVQLEVVSQQHDQRPQIVIEHDGWATYTAHLPAGIASAQVANYTDGGGGHAVVVRRTDALTVAVDAAGVWGNNAAPGSPSATALPTVQDLLTLAASPLLTLPAN